MPEPLPSLLLVKTEDVVELCRAAESEAALLASLERARQNYLRALVMVNELKRELDNVRRAAEDCRAFVLDLEDIPGPYKRVIHAARLDPTEIVRHTLRHTAVTHMVHAGVDLPTVQQFAGHSLIQVTAKHAHSNCSHIAQAMDRLVSCSVVNCIAA